MLVTLPALEKFLETNTFLKEMYSLLVSITGNKTPKIISLKEGKIYFGSTVSEVSILVPWACGFGSVVSW
jgi:hypothetical protein